MNGATNSKPAGSFGFVNTNAQNPLQGAAQGNSKTFAGFGQANTGASGSKPSGFGFPAATTAATESKPSGFAAF